MGSWTVYEGAETGSTNSELLELATSGEAADHTVLRADHQTAGRGRLDRRWEAPAGANLLVSVLFTEPPPAPSVLTQALAVAALDAIERLAGSDQPQRLGLKWPNDLLLDGRKLAGVLAQRSPATGAIVVGMGLNVGWAPTGSASLAADLGLDVTPEALLDQLLAELDHLLPTVATGGKGVVGRYRNRLATLGARVRVELPGGGHIVGQATGLDDFGRLVVDDGEATVTLDVGDIVHLRPI